MKDIDKINDLIASEEARLEKLEEKAADIARKIKTTKGNIEKYALMKNQERFNALSSALTNSGISFEDIVSALNDGNLLSLQEKIEENEAAAEQDENGEYEGDL